MAVVALLKTDTGCPREMEIRKEVMDLMVSEAREYEVKDILIPGFIVRVSPKGLRTFAFRWNQNGGGRVNIGRYPGLPVAAARKRATYYHGLVADGHDPREEKRAKTAAKTAEEAKAAAEKVESENTMAKLLDRYALEVIPGFKANTQRDYKSVVRMLKARFGDTSARAVDLELIQAMHKDLAAKPRTANKHVAILSSVLTQAERWKLRDVRSNPCYLVKLYNENKRVRSLTPKEVTDLMELLKKKEKDHPTPVAILRLLLLTGARPGELEALEWEWVNLKAGVITIPKTHHKTGRKTGEDRFIGLGPTAVAILKARHKVRTSKWVFPNPKGTGPYGGLDTFWKRLHKPKDGSKDELESAGLFDIRPYDLRHTWATWARRGGIALEKLPDMLGHTSAAMSRRYAHAQPDLLRKGALVVEKALGRKVR